MKRAHFKETRLLQTGKWSDWLANVKAKWGEATYEFTQLWLELTGRPLKGLQPRAVLVKDITGFYLLDKRTDLILIYANQEEEMVYWYDDHGKEVEWTNWRYRGRWPWTTPQTTNVFALPPAIWKEIALFLFARKPTLAIEVARSPVSKVWMSLWNHPDYLGAFWAKLYDTRFIIKLNNPDALLCLLCELNTFVKWKAKYESTEVSSRNPETSNFYPWVLYARALGTTLFHPSLNHANLHDTNYAFQKLYLNTIHILNRRTNVTKKIDLTFSNIIAPEKWLNKL